MQRLFSNFADGWAGKALLMQRVMVTVILVYCLVITLGKTPRFPGILPNLVAASAGLFLLIGLWTPIAGAMVAFVELWIVFSRIGDPRLPVILAILGGTLAMIGPGAWSVDACLFGRKQIEIPDR